MTNEQWLVYIYSIYPNGGFATLCFITLICTLIILAFLAASYQFDDHIKDKSNYLFVKLGKYKIWIPASLLFLLFLSSLVPSKKDFMLIVATPYVVDGTKSLVESLQDPTSKAFKINQIMDKTLDKALLALDEAEKDK